METRYCVTVLHCGEIRTVAFEHPIGLVRFLMRSDGHVFHIARVFEIPFQHPIYLGIVSAE